MPITRPSTSERSPIAGAATARVAALVVALVACLTIGGLRASDRAAGPTPGSDHLLTQGEALAVGCTPCHGDAPSTLPALAGRSRAYLRARLEAFRDGAATGTVMPQLVRGYTPAELDALAAWFARRHGTHGAQGPADSLRAAPSARSGE